jgi:hypothetical protein
MLIQQTSSTLLCCCRVLLKGLLDVIAPHDTAAESDGRTMYTLLCFCRVPLLQGLLDVVASDNTVHVKTLHMSYDAHCSDFCAATVFCCCRACWT